MKPHTSHTAPDDIPPVHVLEAAQTQDRKEAEQLLAGFDRPGRGPKKPSTERDFVDYYAKKKSGAAVPAAAPTAPEVPRAVFVPRQIDVDTMVKPRKARGLPAWLGWVAATVAMLTIGGAVAFVATDEKTSTAIPTASTLNVLSATPQPSARDLVPAPTPAEPTAASAVPFDPATSEPPPAAPSPSTRPTTRREPRGTPAARGAPASTIPSPNADRKPPPRDDFIRDL